MKLVGIALTLAGTVGVVVSQQPLYSQCGGIGWLGGTTCVSGAVCTKLNDYYYQCLAGTATPTPTPTTTSTSKGTSTTSTKPSSTGTTTTSGTAPTGTGVLIRAVQDPVYHLYLQNSGGKPVLGPEASAAHFTISGSIALNQGSAGTLYFNVGTASTSYKPLTLDTTATTTAWALEGDTIITTNASPWGRQLNFLACSGGPSGTYTLYLQTGGDSLSGCSLITLHLPCLC